MKNSVLQLFHPLLAEWFSKQVGAPTDVQQQAWPRIAANENVLITAPTGSGKTLTAFLWAIDRLLREDWPSGQTSVLYISPLKALNNDIRRNLTRPLRDLKKIFEDKNVPFPDIHALTRSGDTPQSDRRRMLRHPPEILITTPESLNLMLSSAGGRSILTGITTVILDEIHAVYGTKRGVHLITAVDRLVPLSAEFQRIALSATVSPLEKVASFVGGFVRSGTAPDFRYQPRPVSIIKSRSQKRYDVKVQYPEDALGQEVRNSYWDPLVDDFRKIIKRNKSTLLFTNSRALCEKLTANINHGFDKPLAYTHHGSLSREIREVVEQKLKAGDLKAIVATSSLEMGIDIGALDEVVLIQSPPSISAAIQRIGRAGHQVGEISRSTLFPTHARDFLDAAVLAEAIGNHDIETLRSVDCPLDVLAQVLVSMVAMQTWDIDELFAQIKTSTPYQNLKREQFDQVLNMLAGRYADSRIRELKARVAIDRLDNTVSTLKGAVQAIYMSGGTIPDRGYFHMRHSQTNARIGELDEEFVWENGPGTRFTLGTQTWKVEKVTHNDVFVSPGNPSKPAPPFWKAEDFHRDYHFSERVGNFLEQANDALDSEAFAERLQSKYCLDQTSASQLLAYLKRQKAATRADLPHRHHVLVEHINSGPDGAPGNQVVIHNFWGGQVNRPLGMALSSAWEESFGHQLEVFPTNDSIALQLPEEVSTETLLSMVSAESLPDLLRKQLEGSGFFGARFRECAGRALLLSRGRMNQRMPLWLSRLKSQKLMESVMRYDDFPILLETWRTCLHDSFDLEHLQQLLHELNDGQIAWSEVHTSQASPFAQSVAWQQVNQYMYEDDRPRGGKSSNLSSELIRDVVFTPGLRPVIADEVIADFENKRQRLSPGYTPVVGVDLIEWVKERVLIPGNEWNALLEGIARDQNLSAEETMRQVHARLAVIDGEHLQQSFICAQERLPQLMATFFADTSVEAQTLQRNAPVEIPATGEAEIDRREVLPLLLSEWLQFYGPRTADFLDQLLPLNSYELASILDDLQEEQIIIHGVLTANTESETICDSENFETLLRMNRRSNTPVFQAREIEELPLFLAHMQGLLPERRLKQSDPEERPEQVFQRLEQLSGYATNAHLWESEILPARLADYDPSWLDAVMLEGDLCWIGVAAAQIMFAWQTDLDLFRGDQEEGEPLADNAEEAVAANPLLEILRPGGGRFDFSSLMQIAGVPASQLAEMVWETVWHGQVTNDSFSALRRGIENKFQVPKSAVPGRGQGRVRRQGRRPGFGRWKGAVPFSGNWYRFPALEIPDDLLEIEERNKDRARLLLDRYGIVFRELLQREASHLQWSKVFRSLRLMELAGEVVAGYFFEGIPGPQFMSRRALRALQRKLPEDSIFWLSAVDPASACGLPLDGLRGNLPKRLPTTHLVYHSSKLVMTSERNGKSLTINVPADHQHLPEYVAVLRHLLTRRFQPVKRIQIEAINGDSAISSPYVDALKTLFDVTVDYKAVVLRRREF